MSTKKELLRKLPPNKRKLLAKKNGMPVVGTNKWDFGYGKPLSDEVIFEALLKSPKITKEKIRALLEPTPKTKIEKNRPKDKIEPERISPRLRTIEKINMEGVLEAIKPYSFAPAENERGYRDQLYSFFRGKGYYPRYERIGIGKRLDLVLGEDEILVELKIVTGAGIFDTLYGQIHRYQKQFKKIIVVLIDKWRNPSLLEEQIKRITHLDPENIEVITK